MSDVKDYCDKTYKRLIALKAGLYDVITKAEAAAGSAHAEATRKMRSLVDTIEAGLSELQHQCPSDWSPNKNAMADGP